MQKSKFCSKSITTNFLTRLWTYWRLTIKKINGTQNFKSVVLMERGGLDIRTMSNYCIRLKMISWFINAEVWIIRDNTDTKSDNSRYHAIIEGVENLADFELDMLIQILGYYQEPMGSWLSCQPQIVLYIDYMLLTNQSFHNKSNVKWWHSKAVWNNYFCARFALFPSA